MYKLEQDGDVLEIKPNGPENEAYIGIHDYDSDRMTSAALPQAEAVKAAQALMESVGFKPLSGLIRGNGPKEVFANNALVALEGLSVIFEEEERVAAEELSGLNAVAEEFFFCSYEELDSLGTKNVVKALYVERKKAAA